MGYSKPMHHTTLEQSSFFFLFHLSFSLSSSSVTLLIHLPYRLPSPPAASKSSNKSLSPGSTFFYTSQPITVYNLLFPPRYLRIQPSALSPNFLPRAPHHLPTARRGRDLPLGLRSSRLSFLHCARISHERTRRASFAASASVGWRNWCVP
jgi:hypothetical protein